MLLQATSSTILASPWTVLRTRRAETCTFRSARTPRIWSVRYAPTRRSLDVSPRTLVLRYGWVWCYQEAVNPVVEGKTRYKRFVPCCAACGTAVLRSGTGLRDECGTEIGDWPNTLWGFVVLRLVLGYGIFGTEVGDGVLGYGVLGYGVFGTEVGYGGTGRSSTSPATLTASAAWLVKPLSSPAPFCLFYYSFFSC